MKTLPPERVTELLRILRTRFAQHPARHPGIDWPEIEDRLLRYPEKMWSLNEMEETGGEPDVTGTEDGGYIFCDCSAETPKGRRSLCYDPEALESRKEHKPKGSALAMAADMGVELLTEEQYFRLQSLGNFDTKTSSWIQTPDEVRKLGGAIFGDRRFGRVFVYHNGAESYYGVRGFRTRLTV